MSKKKVTRLTTGGMGNSNPSYSPDGNNMVFTTTRDGNYDAYLSYLASGGPGLRYRAIGNTNVTGRVPGGYSIFSVSWGM